MKQCKKCKKFKDEERFTSLNGGKYRLNVCKSCENDSRRPRYPKNTSKNAHLFCKRCGVKFCGEVLNIKESNVKGLCVRCKDLTNVNIVCYD